jgi:K+-transporting ATPase ATPase C chain
MYKELKAAVLITILFTVLTGIVYPLAVTAAAQTLFAKQANGSMLERGGKVVGSELIGQSFARPEYFHPRPSAAGIGYDGGGSSGSNLGPTNPALVDRLSKGAAQFRAENPTYKGAIPSDAITASGSGLDPEISPANAKVQVARVASARGINPGTLQAFVEALTERRTFGVLGEPRVNVVKLNMKLDDVFPVRR